MMMMMIVMMIVMITTIALTMSPWEIIKLIALNHFIVSLSLRRHRNFLKCLAFQKGVGGGAL